MRLHQERFSERFQSRFIAAHFAPFTLVFSKRADPQLDLRTNSSGMQHKTSAASRNNMAPPRRQHMAAVVLLTWLRQCQNRRIRRLRNIQMQSAQKCKTFFMHLHRRNFFFLATLLLTYLQAELPCRIERMIWCPQRSSDWWEHIV